MPKYAIIVVDMIQDLVTGTLGCDRACSIIPDLAELLAIARDKEIPIIYNQDNHLEQTDTEQLKIPTFGGNLGADIIPELKPEDGDYVVTKRGYGGICQTDMQILLNELSVNTLIITGLNTHTCCQHTVADGYSHCYKIIVPKQTSTALKEEDYIEGLQYLQHHFNAEVIELKELLNRL